MTKICGLGKNFRGEDVDLFDVEEDESSAGRCIVFYPPYRGVQCIMVSSPERGNRYHLIVAMHSRSADFKAG